MVQLLDGADGSLWGHQRPHFPNRTRASAFWTVVNRHHPDQLRSLIDLVSNADPDALIPALQGMLTPSYQDVLRRQGVVA